MQIGVDWGGTSIKLAIIDGRNVSSFISRPTTGTPEQILDTIASAVKELAVKPDRVGLAIPGEVKASGECWRLPNVPGFEGVNIGAELTKRLGCPVAVENDANAAALAERLFGWGIQYRCMLLVTLGTGVGGGFVLDGNIRRGRGGFAGEIGHFVIDYSENARDCGCGNRGCLEAYAGSDGLLALEHSLGGSADSIKQAFVGPHVDAVLKQLGSSLGKALASINNTLDLDAIVFTGGVAGSLDRFIDYIKHEMNCRSFSDSQSEVFMLSSQLGEHAGVIGAANLPQKTESRQDGFSSPSLFSGPIIRDDGLE
ncbi:MAG: ROK family protein [Planctomycetota bacterium]